MTRETFEQVQQLYIEKMGEQLGIQYSALWREVVVLYFYWLEYIDLFGTKPERIQLLNQAAPRFFRMIEDELWEARLLHLARLTDPPQSGGKFNLTIRNLPNLITDAGLKAQTADLIEAAIKATEFCRDWRNRHIAHRDLNLALHGPAQELASGSRAQVRAAMEAIANVLNAVARFFDIRVTGFEHAMRREGAYTLLHVLNNGLKWHRAREERILRGEHSDHDLDEDL
jgi:hypothetical protein